MLACVHVDVLVMLLEPLVDDLFVLLLLERPLLLFEVLLFPSVLDGVALEGLPLWSLEGILDV